MDWVAFQFISTQLMSAKPLESEYSSENVWLAPLPEGGDTEMAVGGPKAPKRNLATNAASVELPV